MYFGYAQVLKPGIGWGAGLNVHVVGFYQTEENSENFKGKSRTGLRSCEARVE